ncbi:MAG: CHAP domain-containing protein [Clostridia bacterium]|nr:CHAP domain-containing protein [Clostridia bacterium]
MAMKDAVRMINAEYYAEIESIKNEETYDVLEMRGSQAVWRDVLSVYAVKVSTDEVDPREVATVDDEKVNLLREIFWKMNEISYKTFEKTHTEYVEKVDENGNIVTETKKVTEVFLRITVSHKSPFETAEVYDFNDEQMKYLTELLKEENRMLWASVLYGIKDYDQELIAVALSQVGNIGGAPYWSWYGFSSRVEWCACFVSWCANECGYIDYGIIPKFAGCGNGASWFQERGQWLDCSQEPLPGMIIFFDWESDGIYDHVGIVYKVEDGKVYTVEGNASDECKMKQYDLGYNGIVGYGMPDY